jgi:hypothetical protein
MIPQEQFGEKSEFFSLPLCFVEILANVLLTIRLSAVEPRFMHAHRWYQHRRGLRRAM